MDELRRLIEEAVDGRWAVSVEIQGDAPAVVIHRETLRDLLAVVDAARHVIEAGRYEPDGPVTYPELQAKLAAVGELI